MSTVSVGSGAVATSADAEVLCVGHSSMQLLLDASATHGALTVHRTHLGEGDVGASPHLHRRSSELFYVLAGEVQVLAGTDLVIASAGDVVVIPPDTPHAFGAAVNSDAELLIVLTPGIERFEFFRTLSRVVAGTSSRADFLAEQSKYDTYGAESPTWTATRRPS